MAEETDDLDAMIRSQAKVPSLRQDKGKGFFPPIARNQAAVKDRIVAALMGLGPALEGARQGAALGDPLVASLSAIAGSVKGPTPQEIADLRRKQELDAMERELSNTPFGTIAPEQAVQMSEFYGTDLTQMPISQVEKLDPILRNAKTMQDFKSAVVNNAIAEESDLDAIADQFGLSDAKKQALRKFSKRIKISDAIEFVKSANPQLSSSAAQYGMTQIDIDALKSQEERRIGRKLTDEESSSFQRLLGADKRLRTALLPSASKMSSGPMIDYAARIGLEKAPGVKFTKEELALFDDKDLRSLVIQNKPRAFRVSTGLSEQVVFMDNFGNTIKTINLGDNKTVAKDILDTASTLATAHSQIDTLARAADKVVTAKPSKGKFDFLSIASKLKQGTEITISSAMRTDPDAVEFVTARNSILSSLSRAAGEKGVLTDQDVTRIMSALPSRLDDPVTLARSIATFKQTLNAVFAARLEMAKKLGSVEAKKISLDDAIIRKYTLETGNKNNPETMFENKSDDEVYKELESQGYSENEIFEIMTRRGR